MTTTIAARTLAAATIGIALAACGSNTSSGSASSAASAAPSAAATIAVSVAAPAASACTLVTQTEASTAMGSAAGSAIAKTDHDGFGSCRYYDATKKKDVFVQFIDPKQVEDMADVAKAMGKAGTIAGVGDKAYFIGGSIFVQKGGRAAQVGLYVNPEGMRTMNPAELELAKTAAGRL